MIYILIYGKPCMIHHIVIVSLYLIPIVQDLRKPLEPSQVDEGWLLCLGFILHGLLQWKILMDGFNGLAEQYLGLPENRVYSQL